MADRRNILRNKSAAWKVVGAVALPASLCIVVFVMLPQLRTIFGGPYIQVKSNDHVNAFAVDDAGLEKLVADMPHLKILGIYDSPKLTPRGLRSLLLLTELERLLIDDSAVTDESVVALKKLTGLRQLNLDNSQITDRGVAMVREMTSLRQVHLKKCGYITDQSIEYLAELPDLSMLVLVGCRGITDNSFDAFVRMPSLTFLIVSGTSVSSHAAAKLREFGIEVIH